MEGREFFVQKELQIFNFPVKCEDDHEHMEYMINLVVSGTIKLPRRMFPRAYKQLKFVAVETGYSEPSALVVQSMTPIKQGDNEDEPFKIAIPEAAGNTSSSLVIGKLSW